jgi:transcriptional regulator with XRE-family HTH domain
MAGKDRTLDTSESFGQWLRKRRRGMDFTQSELANRAGCAQVTIKKLEAGELRPSKALAEALLRGLNIDTNQLDSFVRFARGGLTPELLSPELPKNNLPVELTSFFGREHEIAEIKLAIKEYHLVTLTGPGGIGKTRLSIQVAKGLLNDYPNGVWMVELAELTDPALIPQTVCAALDVIPQPKTPPIKALIEYLRAKSLLLILDNCEHLINACGQLATSLLHACPHLRIIASSREALEIDGEIAFLVPPLSLPDSHCELHAIGESDSVKLFVARTRAVLPGYELTESAASGIAQICRRLDGIPLAIELADRKSVV